MGFVFDVTATEVAVAGTRLDLDRDVVLWLEHQNDCVVLSSYNAYLDYVILLLEDF